jgi:hypothetical protein
MLNFYVYLVGKNPARRSLGKETEQQQKSLPDLGRLLALNIIRYNLQQFYCHSRKVF